MELIKEFLSFLLELFCLYWWALLILCGFVMVILLLMLGLK